MELSSGQQRLLFVVVVLLLAGLGIYLLGPATHHKAAAAPTQPASSTTPAAPSGPASSPASSAAVTSAPPSTTPATSSGASTAGGGSADIYQWLPFTQRDLTQAAQVTLAFAVDYDTFSYTEPAAGYAKKMADVATAELAATLENDYALPSIAAQRTAQKQVSTSSGGIVSIRSFGAGSITFVVSIAQQLGTTTGTTNKTQPYAVTVIKNTIGWQVNDIELATAGNT
jgi:hypothetical protein